MRRRRERGGGDEVVEALRAVSIFSELGPRDLRAVAQAGKEVSHPAGTVLAKEGETGAGFFLILEGTAEVRFGDRVHREIRQGDSFGEVALLDGGPRTATVVAASPVRMLGLTSWAFRALVHEHPSIAVKLLEVLAGHIRRSAQDLSGR
jgi:CRP/FNR family transcriptional regulator, cyclic AMP receptor protein